MGRHPVSGAAVVEIPIGQIVIGERRREKLGRLQVLKKSIETHGLIHPILLRGNTLIAGRRRLEACRLLKWKTIPARQVDRMSDDDLRAIELEENTVRENLNDYATSKARLAQIRQAEADLRAKAKAEAENVSDSERIKKTNKRGRPKGRDVASQRSVAEATGISQTEVSRTERHVELAERYPFMQRGGWVQHTVLEAGVELEKLPPRDRSELAALLDQDAIPPKTAIGIVRNVANMDATDRQSVFDQARSDDELERRTALTRAAAVPAPVDPGLTLLGDADSALRRAAKVCRAPDFKPLIEALAVETTRLYADFQEANAHARRRTDPPPADGHPEATA
jgi:ParB/RepB/Spo0J family partition protein